MSLRYKKIYNEASKILDRNKNKCHLCTKINEGTHFKMILGNWYKYDSRIGFKLLPKLIV